MGVAGCEGFQRGAVIEAGMESLPVVEHLEVFGDGEPGAGPGGKDMLIVHLVFRVAENVAAVVDY